MEATYYDGHTHPVCFDGALIRHVAIDDRIDVLVKESGHSASPEISVSLSVDEAFKLAVALLRDVSVCRYGLG